MSVTLSSTQLWDKLVARQLASPDVCRQWALAVSQSNPTAIHESALLLAELIRLGKLTPFQANVIYRDLPIALQLGQYCLTRSLDVELGPCWFLATAKASSPNASKWLYVMTRDDLCRPRVRKHPPSFSLANKHVAIEHPALDRWISFETIADHLVAVSDPIAGCPLEEWLRDRVMRPDEAETMVQQVASALQALHANDLFHGNVHMQSIWRTDAGKFMLRRDPLFPPVNPLADRVATVFGEERVDRVGTAAPEWILPGWIPNASTDLYSLGCVWYRAISGKFPFADEVNGAVASQVHSHASIRIDMRPWDLLDPHAKRCLSHLIAKNPTARFRSAEALIHALDATNRPRKQAAPEPSALVPVQIVERNAPKPAFKISVPGPGVSNVKPGSTKLTSTSSPRVKRKKPIWLLPSMGLIGLGVMGILIAILFNLGGGEDVRFPDRSAMETNVIVSAEKRTSTAGNNLSNVPASRDLPDASKAINQDAVEEYFAIASDDGKLLWSPPDAGKPYSIEGLPGGPEGIVFLSGDTWHHRGQSASLGKWWSTALPELSKHFGQLPLLNDAAIESVALAIYPSDRSGLPHVVYRLTLTTPTSIDSLQSKLSGFELKRIGENVAVNRGYWLQTSMSDEPLGISMEGMQVQSDAKIQRLTIGPVALIDAMSELQSLAPVRRQMESLLAVTDSRSDITIIVAPSFLFGDGRELLASIPNAADTLRTLLDVSVQAVSISTTIDSNWYLEIRMVSSETREMGKLLSGLKNQLDRFPDAVEAGMLNGSIHPYWKAIALRYPQMLRSLAKYTRFGLEDGQLIANVYLPSEAVGNLAIATWMAWRDPISTTAAVGSVASSTASGPSVKSIDDVLESKISVAFEQESLESALQLIANEVGESVMKGASIPMTINFEAFKKDGITQNQQIRNFQKQRVPVRTVLTDLVRLANPVTTVQSPTEQDQKVVWIVRDSEDGPLKKRIELTTRAWSQSNAAALPREFVAQ